MTSRPLRVALLSYRGHPEVGGQGVYVRYLSRALAELGHEVTVLAGPPYPDVVEEVRLERIESLDLYRPEDPFRRPRREEFRGPLEVLEYGLMCTGGFPEPLTFSLRVAPLLATRASDFDVVHDNQCLGYGLLDVARRLPVVATIHHPISIDRRVALARGRTFGERLGRKRWYSFVRMQARVARRLPRIVTVSSAARDAIATAFGVARSRIDVVPNGVDTELFRPLPGIGRFPSRIVTVISSDQPSKGLDHLIEAVAKLRTERDVELVVIGKGGTGDVARRAARRFGIERAVKCVGRVETLEMVRLITSSAVAVVPSLYEGFSLPAVEAMACGTPLVATEAGALREVVGDAAVLIPPADAGALASALDRVLDDPELAAHLGDAGRERALARFSWATAAEATADVYRRALSTC